MNEVTEFIHRRFPDDSNWLNGNCYYFAAILQARFGGEIYYDVIYGHFVTKIKGKFYDHSGEVDLKDRVFVSWNNFDDYDSLQKIRITEDCLK